MSGSAGQVGDAKRRDWLRIAFYIVTALVALVFLGLFGSIFAFFTPWVPNPSEGPPPGYEFPKIHRWHDAQWGAHTGLLFAGSLLALLHKPERKPVLMQFLIVAAVLLTVLSLIVGYVDVLAFTVGIGLVAALYPNKAALRDVSAPGGWNLALLAVAVVAALVALPYAFDKFQVQMDDIAGDEHTEFHHWGLALPLTLILLAAGVLAATGRPGSRILGLLAGAAFVYLGIAALTSLDDGNGGDPAGIWSSTAALLSIMTGLGYIGATLWRERLLAMLPGGGGPKVAS